MMVVVSPFMWRHRITTDSADGRSVLRSETFRRVCSCGWKSKPYQPDTAGRAAATAECEAHHRTAELFHVQWEIV